MAEERETALGMLQTQRDAVVAAADGLTEAQARYRPYPGANCIVGLLHHLAHVEPRWMAGVFLGGPVSRSEAEFDPPASLTLAAAVDAYRSQWPVTDATVRDAGSLDDAAAGEWAAVDLRWIVLHLIEETARHAGHADLTRDLALSRA